MDIETDQDLELMCGIAGILGNDWRSEDLYAMVSAQRHRGPDGEGIYVDPEKRAGLGHNRLSIIDLSDAGRQPMANADGTLVVTYNGEIYNYIELRKELERDYPFRTHSDTEVLLAAYQKWGKAALDRLIGMFAFVIWDERTKSAFAARDRFGVKPFYYHQKPDGTMVFASEIKAIHAAGVPRVPNEKTWATYLTYGLYDHSTETFWKDVQSLPGGHTLRWNNGEIIIVKWYDLAERVGDEYDRRPESEVESEYFELMKESVKLRFRSDVPVGINLSGGLDSSGLLGLVHEVQGRDNDVKAFTFTTGDKNYDELPWVERMLSMTNHPLVVSRLSPGDVPALAESVQFHQDEPFGGLPTLAYARLFEKAKENGVTVLLDGNGMDEQWAGYDYYLSVLEGSDPGLVQGTKESPVRPECLTPEFRALAEPIDFPDVFGDRLRNLQYRDAVVTKIPRAMRFNDRVSMRSSTELREPFLDHRLFEIALRQPVERKLQNGTGKVMLREIVKGLVADGLSGAPKRPMQTPQREWLRGELLNWAEAHIRIVLANYGESWFDRVATTTKWGDFRRGNGDNSFFAWQWISVSLLSGRAGSTNVDRTDRGLGIQVVSTESAYGSGIFEQGAVLVMSNLDTAIEKSRGSRLIPDSPERQNDWTLVIRPRTGWFDLQLADLWRYRDLVMMFVRRDFVSLYKQTILGPLWFIIQPLLMTLTFTVIFGNIAQLSTDGLPKMLFYLAGITAWNYFSECLMKTSETFTGNAHLFGKVYFPRLSVPVSVAISSLLKFGIQLALLLAFYLYFIFTGATVRPTWAVLLLIPLIVLMAALGLGSGIIVSSLTTRYRDLRFLVQFGTQLLMYTTPVIIPLSKLPEEYRWIMLANPMTPVIETFRYALLGTGTFSWAHLATSALVTVLILAAGVILFNHVEKTFMDNV